MTGPSTKTLERMILFVLLYNRSDKKEKNNCEKEVIKIHGTVTAKLNWALLICRTLAK